MTQFANIPSDIHRHIADFLRPRELSREFITYSSSVELHKIHLNINFNMYLNI